MIQKPAKLSLRKDQLQLENEDGTVTFPIEDMLAIILESPQISLSAALLSRCQDSGVCILTCDKTHMPNGILLPFQPHSRQSRTARTQLTWTESLKGRLWQRIIRAKIINQAACLAEGLEDISGKDERPRLKTLALRVAAGDPANIEALAARYYWPRLFGRKFRRHNNDGINAALNYGYAIMRAAVARAQVAYGLLPAFGLHHDNALNAFNLTDDIMEIFRPFVDRQVFLLYHAGTLTPDMPQLPAETRQVLANIGNGRCLIAKEIHTLSYAYDLMAADLAAAIREKNPQRLPVAEFISATENNNGPT